MKKALTTILTVFITISVCFAQEQVSTEQISTVDGVPVGTIVASTLKPIQFMISTNSQWPLNDPSHPRAKWAPADGRVIEGSIYYRITDESALPDLRGMFLRGLNEFQLQEPRTDGRQDPDGANRVAGGFQADQIVSHQHRIDRPINFDSQGGNSGGNRWFDKQTDLTNKFGGSETRPKNIAVYYYIKIN